MAGFDEPELTIGMAIAKVRQYNKSWSHAQLAAAAGVGVRTIRDMENGKIKQPYTLNAVVKALGFADRKEVLQEARIITLMQQFERAQEERKKAGADRESQGAGQEAAEKPATRPAVDKTAGKEPTPRKLPTQQAVLKAALDEWHNEVDAYRAAMRAKRGQSDVLPEMAALSEQGKEVLFAIEALEGFRNRPQDENVVNLAKQTIIARDAAGGAFDAHEINRAVQLLGCTDISDLLKKAETVTHVKDALDEPWEGVKIALGDALSAVRISKGLTQSQITGPDNVPINANIVAKVENGRAYALLENYEQVARALGHGLLSAVEEAKRIRAAEANARPDTNVSIGGQPQKDGGERER